MSPSPSEMVEMALSSSASEEHIAEQAIPASAQWNTANEVEEPVYELFDSDDEDFQRRCALLEAIETATSREDKRKAWQEGGERFHKHKTISKKQLSRYLARYRKKEFHLLLLGRGDKGQFRKPQEWYDFIVKIYKRYQKDGCRGNKHQAYIHLAALASQGEKLNEKKYKKEFKDFPLVKKELINGTFPSDPTVRKYINDYLKKKSVKARHPGSPFEGQILQSTDGVIELTHPNVAWQCDHTQLDVLIVDSQGDFIFETNKKGVEVIGRPYITIVQDAFSGCVMGFHLGLAPAGSHEVALALRHSILPKNYGSDFDLPDFKINDFWTTYGLPEYFVTDRAKEFKSNHIKHTARQLGYRLKLRSFPQAGGLVETIFDKLNKELNSLLPGYTGSNIQKRPDNAEESACFTLDQLEIAIVRYLALHWNNHDYPKNKQQIHTPHLTRYGRWWAKRLFDPKIFEERELDVCLLKKSSSRKVEKNGFINAFRLKYQGDHLKKYVGKEIEFRYDQRSITRLLAYTCSSKTEPARLIGVLQAQDLHQLQISLAELNWMKRKLDKEGREVNNQSILAIYAERIGLYEEVDDNVSQKRRATKKRAQAKRDKANNQSKVTELFPDKDKERTSVPKESAKQMSEEKTDTPEATSNKTKKPLKKGSQRRFDKSIMDWNDSRQRAW